MNKAFVVFLSIIIILLSVCIYVLLAYNRISKESVDLRQKLNVAEQQIKELRNDLKALNQDLTLDPQKFYAIFFSNGEYYFARMQSGADYFILKNVYFLSGYPDLRTLGVSQQTAKIELKRIQDSELKDKLIRANLSQIHIPEKLNVLKKEVIYYELLNGGSKVVQAIKAFEGE